MNKLIRIAQKACEELEARQVVLVAFQADGRYSVTSYGETKAECAAVAPLCEAIGDALADGGLPNPRALRRR